MGYSSKWCIATSTPVNRSSGFGEVQVRSTLMKYNVSTEYGELYKVEGVSGMTWTMILYDL